MVGTAAPSWRRWPTPCCWCWRSGAILLESVRLLDPAPVAPAVMLGVAAAGGDQRRHGAALRRRPRGRHQPPRRLSAHDGRCRRLRRRGGRGAADPADRLGWIDPVFGLVIAGVILAGTWGLLREAPTSPWTRCRPASTRLRSAPGWPARPGVAEVHDLHIWALSTTETALTAHLVRPGAAMDDGFLAAVCQRARQPFRHRPCRPCRWRRAIPRIPARWRRPRRSS